LRLEKLFSKKTKVVRGLEPIEELVRAGNYLEAIDALSVSNSLYPSSEAETRLIQLRHEALFHMKPISSLSSWPPNSEDLFHDVDGIPEIGRDEFNVENLRAAIFNNGSLIVRNLISSTEVRDLVNDIEKAIETYDVASAGEPLENCAPWFVPFKSSANLEDAEFSSDILAVNHSRSFVREGGGVLAAESPRAFERFISLLRNKSVMSIIEEFLGERPALSVKKTTLRRVSPFSSMYGHRDSLGANGWHQDGAFLGDGIRTVNLWIALSDCGIDAPTMDMVPVRLHEIVPTGTQGAAFNWSVSREIVDRVSQSSAPVRLQFKAGDAILFDEMNLHCTAIAQGMTKDRYAIEAWFFAPSCYPMEQLPLIV
jgi:ectoine hydroxylase-related dioxygenase (phytanoyl-CoA dioxygenase family)